MKLNDEMPAGIYAVYKVRGDSLMFKACLPHEGNQQHVFFIQTS